MFAFAGRRSALLAGTSLLLAALAAPAFAQTGAQGAGAEVADDNQDIIVTATKRATTLQDVPFSINAQTQEDIQRSGAATLEDLSRNVAGLTIQNLGPGQSQVSIRGVSAGQIVRDQPGVKEQVGVYLDESVVSLSLFTPDLDLFDLNRVETLRGPQKARCSAPARSAAPFATSPTSLPPTRWKVRSRAISTISTAARSVGL